VSELTAGVALLDPDAPDAPAAPDGSVAHPVPIDSPTARDGDGNSGDSRSGDSNGGTPADSLPPTLNT